MNTFEFAAVPLIVTTVYLLVTLLKKEADGNERLMTRLPVIAAILGALLGIGGFYLAPTIIPADNLLTALLIGIGSGLAATGTNQIFRQLKKADAAEDKTLNQVKNEAVKAFNKTLRDAAAREVKKEDDKVSK